MFRRRSILVLVALLAGCLATPATAAERVDRLPEIRQFTSGRFEYAFVSGGVVQSYGNGAFESLSRMTYVYVVTGAQPSKDYYLIYDGEIYTHAEGQSEWIKLEGSRAPIPRPSTDAVARLAESGTITRIGDAEVGGTATTHYQIWNNLANISSSGPLKVDLFVGKSMPYVYKLQVTAGEGASEASAIYRFYDQDTPGIVVPAPPSTPTPQRAGVDGGVWKWQQTP